MDCLQRPINLIKWTIFLLLNFDEVKRRNNVDYLMEKGEEKAIWALGSVGTV